MYRYIKFFSLYDFLYRCPLNGMILIKIVSSTEFWFKEFENLQAEKEICYQSKVYWIERTCVILDCILNRFYFSFNSRNISWKFFNQSKFKKFEKSCKTLPSSSATFFQLFLINEKRKKIRTQKNPLFLLSNHSIFVKLIWNESWIYHYIFRRKFIFNRNRKSLVLENLIIFLGR